MKQYDLADIPPWDRPITMCECPNCHQEFDRWYFGEQEWKWLDFVAKIENGQHVCGCGWETVEN